MPQIRFNKPSIVLSVFVRNTIAVFVRIITADLLSLSIIYDFYEDLMLLVAKNQYSRLYNEPIWFS